MVPLPIVSGHGAARLCERWFSVTGLNKIWVPEFIGMKGILNFFLLITDAIWSYSQVTPKLYLLVQLLAHGTQYAEPCLEGQSELELELGFWFGLL